MRRVTGAGVRCERSMRMDRTCPEDGDGGRGSRNSPATRGPEKGLWPAAPRGECDERSTKVRAKRRDRETGLAVFFCGEQAIPPHSEGEVPTSNVGGATVLRRVGCSASGVKAGAARPRLWRLGP